MIIRSNKTSKLELFKWNVETDGEENFNIEKAMNENWDKIDDAIEKVENKIDNLKAEDISFADGETFQEKYDNGELKGEKGDKGDTGENGADGKQGPKGDDGAEGFSPTITEKTNTDTEYVLTITNQDGSFDTPNLKGQDGQAGTGGEAGTTDYEELTNKPSINSVELTGNKSLDDLGIASKESVTAVETDVSSLQDDVQDIDDTVKTKTEPPRSKTITLNKEDWIKNEETGYYEYDITDETITSAYLIESYMDIANQNKMAIKDNKGNTESYDGGFKVVVLNKPTEDVTMDIKIEKTTAEEASV